MKRKPLANRVCVFCGKQCRFNDQFYHHIRSHIREKPFDCTLCDKSFPHLNPLYSHLITHTAEKPFKCETCSRRFNRRESRLRHQIVHTRNKSQNNCVKHQPKKLLCVFCPRQCKFKEHLYHHIRIHIGEKPFDCKLCYKSFSTIYRLRTHMRIHTGEKPYKCEICGKGFSQRESHIKHQIVHTRNQSPKLISHTNCTQFYPKSCMPKRQICVFCGKNFKLHDQLYHHIRIHIGERPFDCKLCDKSFPRNYRLTNHMIIHTGEKPYKCDICNKRFNQKLGLKVHQSVHTTTKTHKCQVCSKMFASKFYLDRHKATHNPVTALRCALCARYFFSKLSYNFHVKTHSKLERFKCLVCESSFAFSYQLQTHNKTHEVVKISTKNKTENLNKTKSKRSASQPVSVPSDVNSNRVTPYKCEICNKFFSQKNGLKIHLDLHKGDKKFQCSNCDKRFVLKAYLDSHMYIHMNDTPFKCHLCSRPYFSKRALKAHLLKHLKDNTFDQEETIYSENKNSQIIFKRLRNNKPMTNERIVTEKHQAGGKSNREDSGKSSVGLGTKTHKCELCNKYFTQKGSLRVHQKLHKGEKKFQCSHCDKRFVLKMYLESHMNTHTRDTPFKCHLCVKSFSSRTAIKFHLFKHKDDETIFFEKTVNANEIYSQKLFQRLIQEGLTVRRPGSSFNQVQCKAFVHPKSKTEFQKPSSVIVEKPYKCEMCNKFFAHKVSLKFHQQIHNNDKKFQCTHCDKKFAIKAYLTSHMYTHMEDTPFQCHLCIKSFSSRTALVRHLFKHRNDTTDSQAESGTLNDKERYSQKAFRRVIQGEKVAPEKQVCQEKVPVKPPYSSSLELICEFCGKVFSRKINLDMHHKFIHLKIRDQECEFCGKLFVGKGGLTRHLKRHTGEKSFKCDLCSASFYENSNLKVHKSQMHAKKPPSVS